MDFGDDVNHRSREYICPVCRVRNIDLLPDVEPGLTSTKSTKTPIILSFGYQKDQINSMPQGSASQLKF
jgi:hypothetical protein